MRAPIEANSSAKCARARDRTRQAISITICVGPLEFQRRTRSANYYNAPANGAAQLASTWRACVHARRSRQTARRHYRARAAGSSISAVSALVAGWQLQASGKLRALMSANRAGAPGPGEPAPRPPRTSGRRDRSRADGKLPARPISGVACWRSLAGRRVSPVGARNPSLAGTRCQAGGRQPSGLR